MKIETLDDRIKTYKSKSFIIISIIIAALMLFIGLDAKIGDNVFGTADEFDVMLIVVIIVWLIAGYFVRFRYIPDFKLYKQKKPQIVVTLLSDSCSSSGDASLTGGNSGNNLASSYNFAKCEDRNGNKYRFCFHENIDAGTTVLIEYLPVSKHAKVIEHFNH